MLLNACQFNIKQYLEKIYLSIKKEINQLKFKEKIETFNVQQNFY
jgi:hypothetical protein